MVAPTPVFACPLCPERIEGLSQDDTAQAPAPVNFDGDTGTVRGAVEYRIAQNVQANEKLVMAHLTFNHTIEEAMRALGRANQALLEIHALLHEDRDLSSSEVHDIAVRGLGHLA